MHCVAFRVYILGLGWFFSCYYLYYPKLLDFLRSTFKEKWVLFTDVEVAIFGHFENNAARRCTQISLHCDDNEVMNNSVPQGEDKS